MLNTMPRTVRMTVADILDERGISTAKFAEMAGLNYNQALAIRRGAYNRLDFVTLAKICDALKVKPGDLLVIEDKEAE